MGAGCDWVPGCGFTQLEFVFYYFRIVYYKAGEEKKTAIVLLLLGSRREGGLGWTAKLPGGQL